MENESFKKSAYDPLNTKRFQEHCRISIPDSSISIHLADNKDLFFVVDESMSSSDDVRGYYIFDDEELIEFLHRRIIGELYNFKKVRLLPF